ncbi:MAG: hypothetical protein ACK4N5_14800 [Myxococcales bacterium]
MPFILALLCVLLSGVAHAAPKWKLAGTLSSGPGIDTNPRRTLGEDVGLFDGTDAFLYLTGNGRARLALDDHHALTARLELGSKKFLTALGEDVLALDGGVGYGYQIDRWLVGIETGGKVRRSRAGDRDYSDVLAEGFADYLFDDALSLRVTLGGRGFSFPDNPLQTSLGPQLGVSGRYQLSRRHGFSAGLGGAPRFYESTARLPDGSFDASTFRRDRQLWAQVGYGYRGAIGVQTGLSFMQQASNSFGESTERYRAFAALSTTLPFDVYAMVQGALQFIRYPDGIFLARELLLQDDEAQSSLAAKLSWPFHERFDVEAKYGLYWVRLPNEAVNDPSLNYLRQTLNLGVAARW